MITDNLDDALRSCFAEKFTMDERFEAETRRMIYEKNERKSNALLCFIQTAMWILSLLMITAAFFINHKVMLFLLSYLFIGNVVSIITVMIFKRNYQREVNGL